MHLLAKPTVIEAANFPAFGSHVGDDLRQQIIVLFELLKDLPNLVKAAAQHCLLDGLIPRLLDIKRHEHVTHLLARRFAHRTSDGLNNIDGATSRAEECDHINSRNVDALGETTGVREESARTLSELVH